MFTKSNLALLARNAPTVCAEKPHWGKSGVPFMYSTTGAADSWLLILSIAFIGRSPKKSLYLKHALAGAFRRPAQHRPPLCGAHRAPTGYFLHCTITAHTVPVCIVQGAQVDARGLRLSFIGKSRLRRFLCLSLPGRHPSGRPPVDQTRSCAFVRHQLRFPLPKSVVFASCVAGQVQVEMF